MKCHYRTCDRQAVPFWKLNDWRVPFCATHSREMAHRQIAYRLCPEGFLMLSLVNFAEFMAAIDVAATNIREDAEFSKQALTHQG